MRLPPLPIALIGCALIGATACKSTNPAPPVSTPSPTETLPDADPESRALAEREIVRRQQAMQDALELLEEGKRMQSAGDIEGAKRAYQQSLQKQPW